jgi:predicted enzyme related to lactoylglutathione lyase
MLFVIGTAGLSVAANPPATPKPHLPPSFGLVFASEQVSDMARSLAFYTAVFGTRVLNTYPGPNGTIREQQLVFTDMPTGGGINLIQRDMKIAPVQGDRPIHLVIRVHDIHATCDRAGAAGGKVTRPPADAAGSGIWVAMLDDPDGQRLEVVQYQ